MKTNIIVVDDFYTGAEGVRKFILTQDFTIKGNYPGLRTKSYATEDLKQYFERLIGKKICYFKTDEDSYNGCFQYTTKDMRSWVHRDCTDWAGIIYLTPDAPPESGTAFFKHKETGLELVGPDTPKEIADKMDVDSNNMSKWEMVDMVGNKFNRLVLFRGKRLHRSMTYFGDDKHSGRLFQLFFFNEVKPKAMLPKPIEPKRLVVLFFTTSRYEYLVPMLKSFHEQVDFAGLNVTKILIDDYPLRRDETVLGKLVDEYGIDKLVLNEENLGYSLSWKKGWSLLPQNTEYIWHQEDDFVFLKPVKVKDMIETLETCPTKLTQVVLKRQRWFENGDFIEKIESGEIGKEVSWGDRKVIVHQTYFNSNPCVYPMWVTQEEYRYNPQEGVIVSHLRNKYPDRYSAMYGGRKDEPMISHIGEYNQGKKVLEGEPGWDWLKDYDPEKKYVSNAALKEWDE